MPDFESDSIAAGTAILERLGEAATFTPAVGAAVALRAALDNEIVLQPGGQSSEVYADMKIVECLYTSLGRVPAEGETFTFGTDVFRVVEVLENDEMWVRCAVIQT